ncbi:protein kinase domain containing protein, partial [Nitzschia inconspicua]
QPQPPGGSSASSKQYGSRSRRGEDPEEQQQGSAHRSNRSAGRPSSSRGGGTSSRSASRYSPQPTGGSSSYYPSSSVSRQPQQTVGATIAPPSSMTPASSSQQHFTPPQGHFGGHHHHHHHHSGSHRNHGTPSTPETNMQPTFPPPAVTSESPPPSEQSQRRPAYLLHRDLVIGKGSYGQVCIASRGEAEGHTTSGRSGKRKKFACKCVMLRNDPKYISKLQEEVNVLRELRGHDNVIRLYDVFSWSHGSVCSQNCIGDAFRSGLFAFKSICHRDLKLENWVLESGKDVWSPLKLIDFGLSTHFRSGERLTRVVGSSYYVAPEVLKKSYTEACDLWSLGVIVYMLLSGAPPFYGKNDEAIKASIVQGEYTFPHELFRDVSDEAMAFVSTLLSYNIEYRYTAAQALTHPWLSSNCDPDALQRAKDGARGIGIMMDANRPEPMQL